jgi:hypothetical protein
VRECKTITNVSDVKLDHVRPDGQWTATVPHQNFGRPLSA